jgi:hypothetical protein
MSSPFQNGLSVAGGTYGFLNPRQAAPAVFPGLGEIQYPARERRIVSALRRRLRLRTAS